MRRTYILMMIIAQLIGFASCKELYDLPKDEATVSLIAVEGVSIPTTGLVPFGDIVFSSETKKDEFTYSIDLERGGFGSMSDIRRVFFEDADGIRISGRVALDADGKATINFAPALVHKAGSCDTITLMVELYEANIGSEHYFSIVGINTTAPILNMDTLVTPTLRAADYSQAVVDFRPLPAPGNDYAVRIGNQNVIGQWKEANLSDKNLEKRVVIVRNYGNGDLGTSLENISLYRGNQLVSKETIVNGKEVMFILSETIAANTVAEFAIRADLLKVDNEAGDTYRFMVRNEEDLNIIESSTRFRATVTANGLDFAAEATDLGTYKAN